MGNIFTVAKQTFIENLRTKKTWIYYLIIVILFCILMTSARSETLILITLGSHLSYVFLWYILGFIGIPFFIYVLYSTVSSLSDDLDNGVVLVLFSRPISRKGYLLSKFLGVFTYIVFIQLWIAITCKLIADIFFSHSLIFFTSYTYLLYIMFVMSIIYAVVLIGLGLLFYVIFKKPIISITISVILSLLIWILPPVLGFISDLKLPSLVTPAINIVLADVVDKGLIFSRDAIEIGSMISTEIINRVSLGNQDYLLYVENSISLFYLILVVLILAITLFFISIMRFSKQDIT